MNPLRSTLTALLLVSLLLCGVTTVSAAEVAGKFTQVQGMVDVLRGGGMPAVPVKVGDELFVKDMIRTKSGATAEVTFRDGNILRVAQRSRLDISTYLDGSDGGNRSLTLPRGKVQAVVGKGVKPGAPPQKFEIRTPNAVAGVRGTDYFVFHERNLTGVLVKSGEVYTYNPRFAANVVTVPAGTVTNVAAKTPPVAPRPATATELKSHEREVAPTARAAANGVGASNGPAAAESTGTTTATSTASSTAGSGTASTGAVTPVPETAGSTAPEQVTTVATATAPASSGPVEASVTTTAALTTSSIIELAPAPLAPQSEPVLALTTPTVTAPTTPVVEPITTTPPPLTQTNPQVLNPVTVDTVAPVVTLVKAPLATTVATATGYAVQNSEPGSLQCRVDNGSWQAFTGTVGGLAEGVHAIDFQATDLAGNVSAPVGTSLFVGSRAIALNGNLTGPSGPAATLTGRLFEFGDKSAGFWEITAAGTGTPTTLSLAAGGGAKLDGTTPDGFWQIASPSVSLSGGAIAGGLSYTYLGTDRLVSNNSGSVSGSYDGSGWNLTASGSATTGYATPLGFVADVKVGPIWRDLPPGTPLLPVRSQGSLDGLLGGATGLWANTVTPFTAMGVNPGPAARNDYWFGAISSKNYTTGGITTYDGGTFSGYLGGANVYGAQQTAMNLAAMYVAPNGAAGLLFGSGSGVLGAGYWSESGSLNRVELSPNIGVTPAGMASDWWSTNTVTIPPTNAIVVTAVPPGSNQGDNNAEGFLVDASLNLTQKFGDRGDTVKFTQFKPDPSFGVWQRESWGSFSGSNTQAVLVTNLALGSTDSNGHIIPDQTGNIVSLGTWGANGDISGSAYGFWGDWAAGRASLMGGMVSGSYNSIGTFGAVTNGTWLEVSKYISLLPAERLRLGFPGSEEATSFSLSGSNAIGVTVNPFNVRIFSNNQADKVKLWAADTISGTFVSQLDGQQVALVNPSNSIRASFRIEHAGISPSNGSNVWLAEIHGLGQQLSSGGFSANFNGVAAGTYSAGSFTGSIAGITHPLTYYSSFDSTTNMLRWFDGAAYQSDGQLQGLFGGMSLWGSTSQTPSDLEMVGLHTPALPLTKGYIFTAPLTSRDIPSGTLTTSDDGAYQGYLAGTYASGTGPQTEPIAGLVNALYLDPAGKAGILTGKFSGYVDMSGIWEGHGGWYPVELAPSLGGGIMATNFVASINTTTPLTLTPQSPPNSPSGGFIGVGGGTLTPAIITDNNLTLAQIGNVSDWGIWRATNAGGYAGNTYDQWALRLAYDDGNRFVDGVTMGDNWSADRLHGISTAAWADMTLATPKTGILVGETIGTFDPAALTWQTVAIGTWLETATYLALAGTTAGQATLQRLNIPAFEIGSADFSGSGGDATNALTVNMTGVKYFAPTAGGRPVIWATGNVAGSYTGNPLAVGNVTLSGASATVSGLSPALSMQSFSGGKWGGVVTTTTAGTVGGHSNIYMNGMAAGSYTGTTAGTFSGTAAGTVK